MKFNCANIVVSEDNTVKCRVFCSGGAGIGKEIALKQLPTTRETVSSVICELLPKTIKHVNIILSYGVTL